ncbi:hypothetical protein LguiA_013381 [Lonicera macranthoides]
MAHGVLNVAATRFIPWRLWSDSNKIRYLFLPLISALSKLRISIPSDLRLVKVGQSMLLILKELGKCFPQGLPKLKSFEGTHIF